MANDDENDAFFVAFIREMGLSSPTDPCKEQEALSWPDTKHWERVMKEEYEVHIQNYIHGSSRSTACRTFQYLVGYLSDLPSNCLVAEMMTVQCLRDGPPDGLAADDEGGVFLHVAPRTDGVAVVHHAQDISYGL